jgi:hypothetical protein
MSQIDNVRVERESSIGLRNHVSKFTACVIDTADSEDLSKWGIFSGTFVKIKDRIFVCTASHCLKDNSLTRYWFVDDETRYHHEARPSMIAVHRSINDPPDVGIIELDPAAFRLQSTKQPCSIERVKIRGTGRRDYPVTLIGTPREQMRFWREGRSIMAEVVGATWNCTTEDPKKWPRVDPSADPQFDIMLEYPSGIDKTRRLDTNSPTALPDPEGMSGGGLWDRGFAGKTLWNPADAFLIGVQTAWLPESRYVRAVQIVHWLRLVHQHYPDLRHTLKEQFPEL